MARHSIFALLLLGQFLTLSLMVSAQNVLQGTWSGELNQEEMEPFNKYVVTLELKQSGTKVWGTTSIHVKGDEKLKAKMEVQGLYKDGEFLFRESRILDSYHMSSWDWCLKSGTLSLTQNDDGLTISGHWEGWAGIVRCNPGMVSLTKVFPKKEAEPVVIQKPEPTARDFGALEGRKVTRQRAVEVYTDKLTLYVWDADKVDGDVISLNYNGEWLLRHHALVKDQEPIEIEVVRGQTNQLILYAENEGRYPPNTAALTFHDGKTRRNLNLTSTKQTCGALRFVLK